MPTKHVFVKKALKKAELEEFLENELGRSGYGGVEVRRLPMGTRVALYVERPGMVIGRKGKSIKQLTDELAQRFGIENPQVEVVEVKVPEFCAPIMAKRIAFALERGTNFRRVGYTFLRRIMRAGARGVEIIISGKLSGERAKSARFYDGYLKKAGESASRLVSVGYAVARLKPGVMGVKVRIMPPETHLPDELKLLEAGEQKPEKGEEPREVEGSGDTEAK